MYFYLLWYQLNMQSIHKTRRTTLLSGRKEGRKQLPLSSESTSASWFLPIWVNVSWDRYQWRLQSPITDHAPRCTADLLESEITTYLWPMAIKIRFARFRANTTKKLVQKAFSSILALLCQNTTLRIRVLPSAGLCRLFCCVR